MSKIQAALALACLVFPIMFHFRQGRQVLLQKSSQSETSYSSVRSPASAILITKARALGTRSFYITWCAQDTMRRNC